MGVNLGVYGLGFRVEDGMLVVGLRVTNQQTAVVNSSSTRRYKYLSVAEFISPRKLLNLQ